jgi:hypothetical protein
METTSCRSHDRVRYAGVRRIFHRLAGAAPHRRDWFSVVEILEDGSCIMTKPQLTGGSVNLRTVKEQLLYEIGDPGNYISPDATVSLLGIRLEQLAQDRVLIEGATGRPPTSQYKVSATYRDGYKAHAMITIFGHHAVQKARKCGEDILHQLGHVGIKFERSLVECLGSGASVPGVEIPDCSADLLETVLRVSVADSRRESVERERCRLCAQGRGLRTIARAAHRRCRKEILRPTRSSKSHPLRSTEPRCVEFSP